jgi:hypothetical protein
VRGSSIRRDGSSADAQPRDAAPGGERPRHLLARRVAQRVSGDVDPVGIFDQLGEGGGGERHPIARHGSLAVSIEHGDHASGLRGRERGEVDGIAIERLAQQPGTEVIGHRRDQAHRGTPACQPNSDIGALSARPDADLRRRVTAGVHRSMRPDHDVQQAIADDRDQHGLRLE